MPLDFQLGKRTLTRHAQPHGLKSGNGVKRGMRSIRPRLERLEDRSLLSFGFGSAFGFGNAVLRESRGERNGASPDSADEPFGAEPTWLLREGVAPQPFNLDALFLWTLLFGLLNQEGHDFEAESEIEEICRQVK